MCYFNYYFIAYSIHIYEWIILSHNIRNNRKEIVKKIIDEKYKKAWSDLEKLRLHESTESKIYIIILNMYVLFKN